ICGYHHKRALCLFVNDPQETFFSLHGYTFMGDPPPSIPFNDQGLPAFPLPKTPGSLAVPSSFGQGE
ncbi:MAG: hypothetical protein ACREBU_22375, partial [Nitrososphaera sp.]